jgi:hypothetical protein
MGPPVISVPPAQNPPSWCHPSDCRKPTGATRRFVSSPKQCHPPVRRHHARAVGATPQFRDRQPGTKMGPPVISVPSAQNPPSWCHPSDCPNPTGATRRFVSRRFVSGRVSRQARNIATRQFGEPPTRCHQPPSWCHPSDCRKPTGSQLVPPVGLSPAGSARKPETVPRPSSSPARCKLGATPQSGGRKWRRCCGPLRPELLPFARSCRLWGFTHRRWLCWPGDPERKASRLKKLSSPTR